MCIQVCMHTHTFTHLMYFTLIFIHIPILGSSFDSQSHCDRNLEGEGFPCLVEEGPEAKDNLPMLHCCEFVDVIYHNCH